MDMVGMPVLPHLSCGTESTVAGTTVGSRVPWARVRTGKTTRDVELSVGHSDNVILWGIRRAKECSPRLALRSLRVVSPSM